MKQHQVTAGTRMGRTGHTQPEGIVDVDAIPSPQDEPVSATLVEEEGKLL
jgi:hypothetical protein